MSINIIDGFYLGNSVPIDSRFVVNNITDRDAIQYKYDGLKVFVISNRTTYIWNQDTVTWDTEGSSSTTGSGTPNYLTQWVSNTSLGTSIVYATASTGRVGVNDSLPLTTLSLKDIIPGSSPISMNIRYISGSADSAVVGYNWYYNSSDLVPNTSKSSTKIEIGSAGGLQVQTRTAGSAATFNTVFELNNLSGYNFLRGLDKGTFISGSVSFGLGTTPQMSPQLVNVGGSFRTSSSFHSYSQVVFQSGPIYTIKDTDHELVFNASNSFQINLPTVNASNVGRILEISNNNQLAWVISFSPSPLGVDNLSFGGVIQAGEKVKLLAVSILGGLSYQWKITEIVTPYTTVQSLVTSTQNNIMNNLIPARTWLSINNYPLSSTALTLGPIYVYVYDQTIGSQRWYHFVQMVSGYTLTNASYGQGRSKFLFQTSSNYLYDIPYMYITKDSVGKVTISGGGLNVGSVPQSYVKYNTGTLGVNAYTEGNGPGEHLIWRIATLSASYRPISSQNNIVTKISLYVGGGVNQVLDGWLVIKSDGNVYLQFKVPSDATSTVGMEIYIPPISWYV